MTHKKNTTTGVAAIEFALIFPVLFLMLYGLITYSMIFAVQHSLNLAAAEGARASIRYQRADSRPKCNTPRFNERGWSVGVS